MTKIRFKVKGTDLLIIEACIKKIKGIKDLKVDHNKKEIEVEFDHMKTSIDAIFETVDKNGGEFLLTKYSNKRL